jgi:hypothetical protein
VTQVPEQSRLLYDGGESTFLPCYLFGRTKAMGGPLALVEHWLISLALLYSTLDEMSVLASA